MKQACNINGPSGELLPMEEKSKWKRCVFRCFLDVATDMAEWTDSGRLFQSEGAQEGP